MPPIALPIGTSEKRTPLYSRQPACVPPNDSCPFRLEWQAEGVLKADMAEGISKRLLGSMDCSIPLTRARIPHSKVPPMGPSLHCLFSIFHTRTGQILATLNPKCKKIEAKFFYFGTKLITSRFDVSPPMKQGITIDLPMCDFRNKVDEDLVKLFKCLEKVDTGKRECRCLSEDPPVFVYTFQPSEQTSNSSVCIKVWDQYASLNSTYRDQTNSDSDGIQVDLVPFFVDNNELACTRRDDSLLLSVMNGSETENCGKYIYGCGHGGLGWEERIWSKRLFWCLEEKHDDLAKMGVTVLDLCDKGPMWNTFLPNKLRCPSFCTMATPFKGVTDILLLGKKKTVLILLLPLSEENVEHVSQRLESGLVVVEIGTIKPKLVDCKYNGEHLPSKLGELLSSMFLISTMSLLGDDTTNLSEIKSYGWLIFRGTYGMAIELAINGDGCIVTVLWIRANLLGTMNQQLNFFLKLL